MELRFVDNADYKGVLAKVRGAGRILMGAYLGLTILGLLLVNLRNGSLGGMSSQTAAAVSIGAGVILLMAKLYILDMREDVLERQLFALEARERLARGATGEEADELRADLKEVEEERLPDLFGLARPWLQRQGVWPGDEGKAPDQGEDGGGGE